MGRQNYLVRLDITRMNINDNMMVVSREVKGLGVLVDCNLSFKSQINQTVRISAYHQRNIAYVRKYLNDKTPKMLIHNHVISKLDYSNSLFYGLPNYLLRKLQLIMNRAASLIKGSTSSCEYYASSNWFALVINKSKDYIQIVCYSVSSTKLWKTTVYKRLIRRFPCKYRRDIEMWQCIA